jgi:hypothetical protein
MAIWSVCKFPIDEFDYITTEYCNEHYSGEQVIELMIPIMACDDKLISKIVKLFCWDENSFVEVKIDSMFECYKNRSPHKECLKDVAKKVYYISNKSGNDDYDYSNLMVTYEVYDDFIHKHVCIEI